MGPTTATTDSLSVSISLSPSLFRELSLHHSSENCHPGLRLFFLPVSVKYNTISKFSGDASSTPSPRSVKVENKYGNWISAQMVLFFTRLPAPGLLLPTLTDRGRGVTAPLAYVWKWYFISQTPDPSKSKLLRFRFYFLATSECLNQCIREAMGPILSFQLALRVELM